jgi:hypothetical protein
MSTPGAECQGHNKACIAKKINMRNPSAAIPTLGQLHFFIHHANQTDEIT